MPLISLAGTKRKVGRPSVIEAHPEIVEIVRDFITQHSSSGCLENSDLENPDLAI